MKFLTLEEILDIENNVNPYEITEVDQWNNKLTRAKIRAFKETYGKCYLIDINKEYYVKYRKGIVYNFQYDYMTKSKKMAEKMVLVLKKHKLKESLKFIKKNIGKNIFPLLWV